MNHLVFVDTCAGELEKILSGVKNMVLKVYDPTHPPAHPVSPGDNLYFLRNNDECTVRVSATVIHVLPSLKGSGEDLSHTLKELQPKLQLTEAQYKYWSAGKQVLLVEFDSARKIDMIQVSLNKITKGGDWTAFEEISLITEEAA